MELAFIMRALALEMAPPSSRAMRSSRHRCSCMGAWAHRRMCSQVSQIAVYNLQARPTAFQVGRMAERRVARSLYRFTACVAHK
jgi:hypothetical protein